MMSLKTIDLAETVKKQFVFKLKANIDVFSSLVWIQLLAILFSLNGVASMGVGGTNLSVDVKYYSETVTFAQSIKLKSPVKTNLSGTIKYMVCNDKMCLPPKTISFNVPIQ